MKKVIYSLLIVILVACSADDSIDKAPSRLEITYQGYYEVLKEVKDTSITLKNIMVLPVVEQVSDTEEIDLLQIIATGISEDTYIAFKVLPNIIGNNALYNNEFDFRTPEGTPYSTEDGGNTNDINFQVLVNDDIEFIANFSGSLKHYNQYDKVYIYLEIKSGSIKFEY